MNAKFYNGLMSLTLLLFGSAIVPAVASQVNDSGPISLATRLVSQARTIPFDGPLRQYRGYLFDSVDVAFHRAYHRAIANLPKSLFARMPFIANYEGVMSASESIAIGSRKIIYSSTCQPHSCFGHTVYLAYDPDRDRAWGVVDDSKTPYLFGRPTPTEKAELVLLLARETVGNHPFPLSSERTRHIRMTITDTHGNIRSLVDKIDSI